MRVLPTVGAHYSACRCSMRPTMVLGSGLFLRIQRVPGNAVLDRLQDRLRHRGGRRTILRSGAACFALRSRKYVDTPAGALVAGKPRQCAGVAERAAIVAVLVAEAHADLYPGMPRRACELA